LYREVRAAIATNAQGDRVQGPDSSPDERFRTIVAPYLGDALSLARWLTGNAADAEDVVQEAAIRAVKGLSGYAGGNPRAWLLSIVRNTSFTWLARHRPRAIVVSGDDSDTADQVASDEPDPEAALIAKADAEAVARAISALPQEAREILVLRDINGLAYRDIAGLLDIPIGTVMSRLARARGQLGRILGRRP
jgi:RNA polymerase sigma factor (sigma-70 family)